VVPLASRHNRRPTLTPVMALLLATLGLTGVLTYQAVDAAASHRRTAERALRDHATFAAWVYTRLTREEIRWSLFSALKPLAQHTPEKPDALPTAQQLENSIRALSECDCPAAKLVHAYFAIDLKHGHAIWRGKKPDQPTQLWVSDTVRAHGPALYGARWDFALILGTARATPAIAYILRRDVKGEPRVAAGAVLDTALLSQALNSPYQNLELLPSTLTGETSNAPVLHVAVTLPSGDVLYSGGNPYPETVTASDTLGVQLGHLSVDVTLNPGVAQRLVIGGLPRSRMPLLLGLLGLTAGLAAVTLRQLRKEQELTRLRSDFVSGVSHELRTPLAQVRMFTETLALERVRSPDEARHALDIILRESERLSHLVDNVLEFSRAERGTVRLTPEPTRLDALLKDVVDGFHPLAEARHVSVGFSSPRAITATVDGAAVRQIVLNLLDNAVKYGPSGQSVCVNLALENGSAVITVEDQGPGIPARAREKVWQPYWRLPRERESAVGGSGIGLAVVKELVTAHGGSVSVMDGAAGGARFEVRLPTAPPTAPA
jgi:signal transduction histidine kinase